MAITPRKIRQLPPALPAKGTDVFPVSQMDETGVATTRAMSRDQFQTDIIEVINAARQEFVDTANAEHAILHTTDNDLQAQIDELVADDEAKETLITMIQEQIANGSGGKNAFQLWQGLPGNSSKTLNDFLEAYRGMTGSTGPQGTQGPQGLEGIAGPIGPTGATGPQGPTGLQGSAGPTGSQGPKGDSGSQGIQGVKGDKGDTGAAGATGAKGDTGATGPAGTTDWSGITNKPSTFSPDGTALKTPTVTSPTRTIGTAFQPSATRPTLVSYSVRTQVTNPLVAGASTAMVQLMSDANATPTTERARVSAESSVALAVAIAITTANVATLTYIVPAGHYVRLVSTVTGTGATSIISQNEETL